ncbi:MAG: two-component system sensor histidine kinase NtrB [Alphaproteobacteria bacterium]
MSATQPAHILSALAHPVLVITADEKIDYVNTAAEQFFSAGNALLMGAPIKNFVPFGSPLLELIAKVRRQGTSVNEYGVDLGTPRSGPRTADIQVSRLNEAVEDSAIMVMLLERNIANTMDRQLIHRGAARSVTAMAGMLAHEIKNPLSGIKGAAQLLELDVEPEGRELTRLICNESDRICKIVDRMEVFSNQRPIERNPVNIHEVLDHVSRLSSAGFAEGVEFTERYDPSLPPVLGEKDQLIQVFLNLVKNAAEAVPAEGGQIQLSTAYRSGVRIAVAGTNERLSLPLEVCVIDNGPGVPEELREHLFDPFVTTKPKGQGLGLALVAKIVGDHGGVIECESERGHTIFRVLLPLHKEQV